MKKTHTGRIVPVAALLICFIALFTTCKNNIGMGGTIDINPPTIKNDSVYPPNNAVIKGAFRLAVKADDDTGVNAVTAVITTANAQNSKINIGNSFLQRPSSKDGYWTLDIDPKGEYPIGDGAYKVEIQATDTAGKVATVTSAFTIDNTPPLLILNRPSTAIAKSEDLENSAPDEFGFDFLLVGQVYDESAVPMLKITAKGNGQEREKTLHNIPQNIRITVDSFGSSTDNPFYKPLYNGEENGGSKKYEYGITVTDAAKQYNNPGDGGTGTGNTTNRYYLFDDLYKPVLSTYKIQEVYAMLRGTYNSESGWMRSIAGSDQLQDVKKALQNYQIGGGTKKGSFALNPSRNPRFAIAGEQAAPRPSNPSGAPSFSPLYSGSSLKVKISHNLDGVPLEGADTYRFFLMKWSDFLTYTGSSPYPTEQINGLDTEPIYTGGKLIPINNPSFQREGSNYLFTLPISASLGITYNNNYVLLVRGKDQNGNKLIPDLTKVAGGAYGFSFVENGKAPEVYVTKIRGSVSGYETLGTGTDPDPNKKNITERVYLKKDDGMEVTVHIGGGGSGPSLKYELTGTVGGNVTQDNVPAVGNTITIPSGKFDQNNEKTYTLTVWATASTGTSLIQTYHIVYDVKEPEADIITLVNDSVITEVNGTAFSVSGTAFDSGIGLADVAVKLSKTEGKGLFEDRALTVTTADGRWETQTMDLSGVADYGEGKYTLTMTAKDKLGLSKTLSRTFYYDKKAPEITEFKVNGEAVTNGRTVYTKTTPVAVTGNVTESYGIDTFTINGDNNGLPSTDADVPTAPFNKQLNLSEGLHSNVAIILKDKAGQSAPDFKFDLVVDTTAPNFETSTSAPADQIQFAGQPASGVAGAAAILTSNNPLKITGLIKDPVSGGTASGIKEVQYAVTASSASEPAFPSSEWKMLNGTHESDGNYRLSGFVQADGEKKVWIKAVDNAGNERVFSHKVKVVPPAVITWKLELENNTPSGTVKYNAGTWYAKGQFKVKIGGTLNSAPPGGSPMNVEIKQGSTTKALTDFFGDWTGREARIYSTDSPDTYTVKSGQTEGEYTIKIDDAQGQAKLLTFTIDGTAPTITLDPSVPAHDTWVNTKALLVSGTAADATSGIEKIEASVNGTEKLLGTDASWSGYLTLNEGNNTVQFKVTDKAGNTASTPTSPRTIKVDTGRPTIGLTTPADGQALVNSTSTSYQVTVTVSDTGGSGIAKVEYATTVGFASPQSATPSGGSATINLTGINGDTTYYFRAVDNAGNTSDSVRVTIQKDNTSPTITFDSPQNNQIVNKIITIKGTASDNNGLQSVKIVKVVGSIESDLTGVSASSGYDSGDTETADTKALFKGTKAYNWQFDLDTNRTEYPNGPLTLKAIATDAAGNTEVKLLTLNVDQNSDRPQIVITNLNDLTAGTYLTASTLNFVIIDDDGEIEDGKFEITSEPANAGTLTKTVGGWQYAFAQDGQKTLKFKVTDKKGGVFETDATDKPRVYAKNTTTTASDASVELKVDTKPPQSETPALQFSNASDYSGLNNLEQNAKFNGGMLYLQIMASDASGIQSVTGKIDNVTSTTEGQNIEHAAAGTAEKWRIKLDLSGVTTEGIKTLTVELTDKAGAKTQFTRTIVLDKTAPTVELTYPAANSAQSGKITVQGNIADGQDGTGTKAEATKWIVVPSASGEPTAGTTGWKNMKTSTAANWSFDLDFAADFTSSGGHAAYGTPNAVTPAYYDIPVYILTEDNVGNKAVRKITVLYNPDGTKPVVEVLSPTAGSIVGGTIQIFGTGKVAVGTPDHVGEVHIQFSKTQTFDSTNCTINGENWWNGGSGVLVPNTAGAHSGASWRMDVNSDGNLNNPSSTEERWTLWFRLRAKNKHDNKMGEWTAPIKIIVDKSAPTIGSKIPLKLEHGSQSDDYIPNMWIADNYKLTGSLHDESGIKSIKITGDLKNGIEYDLAKALTDGWIVEDTVNTPTESGKKNYKLQIPLTLNDLKEAAKGKKEFKFTLYVEEDTDKRLSAEKEFTFKFDTEAPTGAYGEHKLIGNGNFEAGSITDTVLAAKIKELAPTTDYSKLGILAGGKALTIQSVTGNKVAFTPTISEGRHNYMLYRKGASLIYNASGNWVVKGVAHDEGIGVKEVKVTVTVNSSSKTLTIPESSLVSSLSGLWAWEGQIDLSTLSDGKGVLSYEITDKLGNKYTPSSIEVRVKNKPVKISKVILQTEIGGQPVKTDKTDPAETDPKTTVTKTSDAQLDQTVTVGSKNFAFKSKTASKIKVEFDGGQGSVRYRLRKGGTVLKEITLPNLPSGIIGDHPLTSGDEIDLKDHLAAIGNSNGTPTTITLELWDEAHGYTQGTDSSWAKVDITTLFDALDQTDPTVVILPFHWNSEDNNSLYKNKRDNGHVEIKETGNSQVSGKVTLRGFAYDNIELNEITATLPNSPELTVTATRQANGTWSSNETMAADGAELTVTKLGADYLGYYVAWQLDWDTEKATVEAAAKEIRIQAKDGANNTSALPPAPPSPPYSGTDMPTKTTVARSEVKKAESAVFAGTKRGQFVVFKNGETQYLTRLASVDVNEVTLEDAVPTEATDAYMYDYTANKSAVNVNVVPYIIAIENEAGEGLGNSVLRGSDGSYSMNYSTSEKMIVKGFNLKGAYTPVTDGTTATIGGVTATVSDISDNQIKISKNASKSGDLSIFVKIDSSNSVESINNKVDITKPYNQEKDITNPSSNLWSAKRKVVFWENKQVCTSKTDQTFYYPSMVMDSDQPIFAYCNNNDGFTWRTINDATSEQRTGIWYARNAVLAKTTDNKYIITTNEDNFSQNNAGFLYVALDDTFQGAKIGTSMYPSKKGEIELCGVDWDGTVNGGGSDARYLNRFKYPNLIADGVRANLQIYVSYYEAKKKQIQFFAFKVEQPNNWTYNTNLTEPTDDFKIASNGNLAVPNTTGGKSSEHTAMAKVGAGIYIAYHDANSTTLKLTYSKAPVITGMTGANANKNGLADTAAVWETLEVDNGALTGQYVSMAAAGTKLYIAYHDASNAALKLAVVETTGTVSVTSKVIVDAYQSVGYKTGITMVGDVPYISYYNNAQAGTKSSIKVAYPKDAAAIAQPGAETSGAFTGNWVARYIPSLSVPNVGIPEFNRVMIDNYTESGINKPVLAWLGEPFIEYTKMK